MQKVSGCMLLVIRHMLFYFRSYAAKVIRHVQPQINL